MLCQIEIEAEFVRLVEEHKIYNLQHYKPGSLHDMGFPSLSCPLCGPIEALKFVLCRNSKASGLKARTTANITGMELQQLQFLSKRIEKRNFEKVVDAEMEVNNLYEL